MRACDPVAIQHRGCGALNHLSPGLPRLLDQLNDFALPTHVHCLAVGALSPYIAQVKPDTGFPCRMPRTAAITIGEFISKGGRSYSAGLSSALALRARGAQVTVLVGTSRDAQLEAIWQRTEDFVNAVKTAKFDLVLGPAYSIYVGRSPIEHAANRARNLAVNAALTDAGIRAVPAVGFVDAWDAERAGAWLKTLGMRTVFVDLQSADSPTSWSAVRAAIPVLLSSGAIDRLIINGVSHPGRVREMAGLTRPAELILTNGSAFQLARIQRDYFVDGSRLLRKRSGASPEQIFAHLSQYYHEVAAGSDEGYLPLSLQPMML